MGNEVQKIQENLPQVDQNDPMLSMIERVCSDPNFDIQKMEKLVEMRNQEMQRVAKIDFNRDYAEMQELLPRVVSDHRNNQTNSNYAKIEDINNIVLPIINKKGFGVSFKIISQDDKGITVRAILSHKQGHEEFTDLFTPLDRAGAKGTVNKTDIHATGSAITYAKRYAICALLNISVGSDDDGNAAGVNKPVSETQAELLKEKLMQCPQEIMDKFRENYGDVGNVPAKQFDKLIARFNKAISEAK